MQHTAPLLPLDELVEAINAALYPPDGHQLLRVVDTPSEVEVARRPLAVNHPLEALLGFTAPDRWRAIGLSGPGRAVPLGPAADDTHSTPIVAFTVLLDRSGQGAGVMQSEESVMHLPGPPEGLLGDACRLALGLPTAPPPPDTVDLWLRCWLDRLIEMVAYMGSARHYQSWEAVTAVHPVATAWGMDCPDGAPVALADATRRLAEAWPWARLRKEPDVLDTPGPPLHPDITNWMDDGMFARWVLAAFPSWQQLADASAQLLPASIATTIAETVVAAGIGWPLAATSP